MRERPILFSGPMVRAILDGRKTQARRIVKPQPVNDAFSVGYYHATCVDRYGEEYPSCSEDFGIVETDGEWYIKCPYGEPGDRLWIKTGYQTQFDEHRNATSWSIESGFITTQGKPLSKSGKQKRDGGHPSMFMPFWLSQELKLPMLEITSIRVERLQDISEADAMAEGCERIELGSFEIDGHPVHPMTSSYAESFQKLWGSINGPESWSANPWVWVIEFRRLQ